MRKKAVSFWMFLTMVLAAAGCGTDKGYEEKEYQVYCLNREDTHIETVEYESTSPAGDIEAAVKELIEQLSVQNGGINYKPAIAGFTVKDCIVRESQVTLNLSEDYKNLDVAKEVLTRAAIVKTLTQIEGVELVDFQVDGSGLLDSQGNVVGVMNKDTFIDNTGQDMKKYDEVTLALYFANITGDELVKVNRTLRYNTNIALEKLVVEQLIAGPVEQKNKEENLNILPTLNPATKIINVSIKDSICYVNLDSSFLTTTGIVIPEVTIYSLVNSLTELPGVLKVQIAVEGETELPFGEVYHLSTLFERNPDLTDTKK